MSKRKSSSIGKYKTSHPILQGGVGETVPHDWGVLSERSERRRGACPPSGRKSAKVAFGNQRSRFSCYEGLQKNIRKLKTPVIEVWKNQFPDKRYIINLELPEFTCICPKTGLPDFATLRIEYSPDKYCIELKSFKMYTIFYRNLGIFHENVVNKMLQDLVRACKPRWLKITGEFNVRGGIKTVVTAEHKIKPRLTERKRT